MSDPHPHDWRWIENGGGPETGFWDKYQCQVPGCGANKTEQR